jgi:hypothetical protein
VRERERERECRVRYLEGSALGEFTTGEIRVRSAVVRAPKFHLPHQDRPR